MDQLIGPYTEYNTPIHLPKFWDKCLMNLKEVYMDQYCAICMSLMCYIMCQPHGLCAMMEAFGCAWDDLHVRLVLNLSVDQ